MKFEDVTTIQELADMFKHSDKNNSFENTNEILNQFKTNAPYRSNKKGIVGIFYVDRISKQDVIEVKVMCFDKDGNKTEKPKLLDMDNK